MFVDYFISPFVTYCNADLHSASHGRRCSKKNLHLLHFKLTVNKCRRFSKKHPHPLHLTLVINKCRRFSKKMKFRKMKFLWWPLSNSIVKKSCVLRVEFVHSISVIYRVSTAFENHPFKILNKFYFLNSIFTKYFFFWLELFWNLEFTGIATVIWLYIGAFGWRL